MEILTNILELIYFLSGPAILVVAIIGLKQITISKENRQISSTREAYKLAADQCRIYVSEIIPLMNNLDKKIKAENIDYFEKSKVIIKNNRISVEPYIADGSLKKVDICLSELNDVWNHLETFSLFFASGIASEKVGFMSVGHTFVNNVKKILPFFIRVSNEGEYQPIYTLFGIWHSRIEKEKLIRQKSEIEKKLKGNSEIILDPIGTKN